MRCFWSSKIPKFVVIFIYTYFLILIVKFKLNQLKNEPSVAQHAVDLTDDKVGSLRENFYAQIERAASKVLQKLRVRLKLFLNCSLFSESSIANISVVQNQRLRVKKIQEVCLAFRDDASKPSKYHYQSKTSRFDQDIDPRSFLLEPVTRVSYCVIRKVASSSWQTFITNIHQDDAFIKQIIENGQMYR